MKIEDFALINSFNQRVDEYAIKRIISQYEYFYMQMGKDFDRNICKKLKDSTQNIELLENRYFFLPIDEKIHFSKIFEKINLISKEHLLSENEIILNVDLKKICLETFIIMEIKDKSVEYNPQYLFKKFALLGENLIVALNNNDNESFIKELTSWINSYGTLVNPRVCLISNLVIKSIIAYVLDLIYDKCSKNKQNLLDNLQKIFIIKTKRSSNKKIIQINPYFFAKKNDDTAKYLDWLKKLQIEIDQDTILNTVNDYKKLAIHYISKMSTKIIQQYTINIYNSPLKFISEPDVDINKTGYYVDSNINVANFEQIIFFLFLRKLQLYPNKRTCMQCGQKIPQDKHARSQYCSDTCKTNRCNAKIRP